MGDARKALPEPFVVRHYTGDDRPILKGNGFDGLEIGRDREEAEAFVTWLNAAIQAYGDARAKAARMEALEEAVKAIESVDEPPEVISDCADAIRALGGKGAA